MALAVLATPACPPTRHVRCSRNSSAAPHSHSRIPGRLASALSSPRISNAVVPLIHQQPPHVTSTGASARDIPSAPRQQSTAIISSRHSDAAVVARSVCTPPLPREKSSEPLKSSLKVRRAHSRDSLSVITDPVNSGSSKGTPATPVHKGVRFHSQLEHVKLFLAKQKPLAVSRDGNPTDTSGTESEFPPFIYHDPDDDLKERPLVMHRVDVPTAPPLPEDTRDVVVENIDLVGTVVEGTVRVRNIAFEKRIAVRFTLDKWQTTSEVTARYKESLHNGTFDRFMFSIKLADVLSRAEDKTLYLSVRYSAPGREIWDNNSGRNYQVRFVSEKALKGNREARAAVVESREESSQADDVADLRRKLEELVELGCPPKTVSDILAQESRRRCESPSPARSPPLREATPSFRSAAFPAGRYDFAASSRTPWCPPAVTVQQTLSPAWTHTPLHARTRRRGCSFKLCASPVAAVSPTTATRTAEVSSFFPSSDSDDPITLVPSLPSCGRHCSGSRNHTRGGTIVLSDAPGVKRTPPTSPLAGPVPSTLLFPPLPASTPVLHACSDSSTPSSMSSSWSRSHSTSPSLSPAEPVSPTRLMSPVPDTDKESDSPIHHLDYYKFVNRYGSIPIFSLIGDALWDADLLSYSYCFYTGSGPGEVPRQADCIPRSLSASSVEAALSIPYPSDSPFATHRAQRQVHETASDDELQRTRRKGSATLIAH